MMSTLRIEAQKCYLRSRTEKIKCLFKLISYLDFFKKSFHVLQKFADDDFKSLVDVKKILVKFSYMDNQLPWVWHWTLL